MAFPRLVRVTKTFKGVFLCMDCSIAIEDYAVLKLSQSGVELRGTSPDAPLKDHIVGYAEMKFEHHIFSNKSEEVKQLGYKEILLPVYDFFHKLANDDYSPDAVDAKERTVTLSFTTSCPRNESRLEEVIANHYRYFEDDNIGYELVSLKYEFVVRGSRKSKRKIETDIESETQKKRLLDLYETKA